MLTFLAFLIIAVPESGTSSPQSPGPWFMVHTFPFEDTEMSTWEGPYFEYKDCAEAMRMQLRETPGENLSCVDGSGLDL